MYSGSSSFWVLVFSKDSSSVTEVVLRGWNSISMLVGEVSTLVSELDGIVSWDGGGVSRVWSLGSRTGWFCSWMRDRERVVMGYSEGC